MARTEDILRSAMTLLAVDGKIGGRERRFLDALRQRLGVSPE